MAGFLMGSLPDLTALAANNGGVFPVTAVYMTLEGPGEAGAHGSSEMPIWGNRFRAVGANYADPDYQEEQAAVYAKFRILALTEFLAGIQE
jgi:hypothetical protein